jgi:hypothetical protein
MIKKNLILGMSAVYILFFSVPNAWPVTINQGVNFINSQTNYTSGTTFNASSIQVQPSHIYLGSKYYDLTTIGGKVAANVTSFYENQNATVHILNSSLTNVNMTVAGEASRVSIDDTFYNYGTKWSYLYGNSTLINVQSGKTIFVDFNPAISLNVTSGVAGTNVNVSGNGFADNSALSLLFDTSHLAMTPSSPSANSTGWFSSLAFTVPSNATVGSHTVEVIDASGNNATESFTVQVVNISVGLIVNGTFTQTYNTSGGT